MKYDFDRVIDRQDSGSIKWDLFENDVLPLWVADMDFATPPPVIKALHDRINHQIFGYESNPEALIATIQKRFLDYYQWRVEPEELVFTPGVMKSANMVALAVGKSNEELMFQTPVYHPFFSLPKNAERILKTSELIRCDNQYEIDFDHVQSTISNNTKLFVLCNPHNPVGRVFKKEELLQLADICIHNNTIICSDEIHCDLVYRDYEHIPIASLSPEIGNQTISLFAPSKTFNIPGLSCSFMVIQNRDLRKAVKSAGEGLVDGVNLLGTTAALAAYQDCEEWRLELLRYLKVNRDFVYEYIQKHMPEIQMHKPEGTFLAWLDCRQTGIEGNPYKFFLNKARVAFNNGESFGAGGKGFVRLNFGCPQSTLKTALDRMATAIKAL